MKKSFFGVSGLVSAAGLLAALVAVGCSDDAAQTTIDATEPEDGGAKAPPRSPPRVSDDADDEDDGSSTEAPTSCVATTPFDATTVPYRSPAVKAGSCTSADIKLLTDYLRDNQQFSMDDIKAKLAKQSQRCGGCVFGAPDDDTWAPIVFDGTTATLNGGGCVSVVSGEDDCGKAYQQWNTCLNEVCAACTDPSENAQCKNDVQQASAPCGAASKALLQACGTNVNDYLGTCFGSGDIVGNVVTQLCGSPSKDGGA